MSTKDTTPEPEDEAPVTDADRSEEGGAMTDDDAHGATGLPSIFDVFDPPPDVDPNRFGPVPVVSDEDGTPVDESALSDEVAPPGDTGSSGDTGTSDDIRIFDDVTVVSDSPEPDSEDSGDSDLPPWTAAATGQVPEILARPDDGRSELRGPRWKGEGPDWADDDLEEVFGDDESRVVIDDEDDELASVMPPAAGAPQRGAPRPRSRPGPPPSGERNMTQAVLMGVALAAVAFLAFALDGNLYALGLITIVSVLASAELFRAFTVSGTSPASLLGVVASGAFPLAVYYRGEPGFVIMVALLMVFGALWYIVGADTHKPTGNLGLTFLGTVWVGAMAAFGSLLLLIEEGKWIIVAAIVITVASDTAALAIGKAFGKTKFHDASPNKTWEGTIGGFIGAVVAGLVLGILEVSPFSGSLVDATLLGVVGGVMAPLGDLTESLIKRDLGVKDMGSLLPGHGGVMDRIDSLLFVLPAAYYLTLVLGLDQVENLNTLVGQ